MQELPLSRHHLRSTGLLCGPIFLHVTPSESIRMVARKLNISTSRNYCKTTNTPYTLYNTTNCIKSSFQKQIEMLYHMIKLDK